MNIIAAVDEHWGIGYKGELLEKIPEDLKRFKSLTYDKVVIYGRKTMETFPHKRPLEGRKNIILTSNKDLHSELIANSIEEVFQKIDEYKQLGIEDKDIFVIGGASVYKQLLPFCDTAYITKIHFYYLADAFFPDLDKDPEWYISESDDKIRHYYPADKSSMIVNYSFKTYKRIISRRN